MSISGIVLTLSEDPCLSASAMGTLGSDPRITLGERFDRRVAAVAETGGVEGDRRLWDDLHNTPGIVRVDVTFVELGGNDPELE